MFNTALNPEAYALYRKIAAFRFDEADVTFTFLKRLAQENAWSEIYAGRVIEEYRRFLLLASLGEGTVSPSDAVDQAWHLHMLYSRSYWDELCGKVLQKSLHHDPIDGGGKDRQQFIDQYASTLERYRSVFGEAPPADIWPDVATRFGSSPRFQRVDMNHYQTRPLLGGWLRTGIVGGSFLAISLLVSPIFAAIIAFFIFMLTGVSGSASASSYKSDGGGGCGGGCGGSGCGGGGCGGGCGG